ncbi:carbohydrate kinase family protein [Patiriisocius marinus]|uniref:Putative sugar kinase YdjE n=1 Tax=Patiriisocius marinus TaxID=1397112 RepID=A0A5J4J113_9FLAO|nr:PfkB family carbohydrate kinase [Patiriisocius marinus]GER59503.1 putative sugar kinase YdjE [Patiriisocius marinus]
MKNDILCVGEALVDFIGHEKNKSIKDTRDYHRYLGGSVTNVAMNLARLGLQPRLVATIGNDGLGEYILRRINEIDIDSTYVRQLALEPTSTIFISRATATPDFIPYRAADANIVEEQIPSEILQGVKIFHTTCFALSKNPARDTILKKANEAHSLGIKLSIDINYSSKIWGDRVEAQKNIEAYSKYNPLIKVSEDDMQRYFNQTLSHQEIFEYFHSHGADVVCLTLGANGVKLAEKGNDTIALPAEKINEVMDATGAGDAFWSGFLFSYINKNSFKSCLEIASKLAALKLQHVGRLPNNINVISKLFNTSN